MKKTFDKFSLNKTLTKDLCILLSFHLKQQRPDIYTSLINICNRSDHLKNIDTILSQQYNSFSQNQFQHFTNSLRTNDDFPSIFRRQVPFSPKFPNFQKNFKLQNQPHFHSGPIFCLIVDPLSRILISGSDDFKIKIFQLPYINLVHTFSGHKNVISNISINPECSVLLSSSHDKTIRFWCLRKGNQISCLTVTTIIYYSTFNPTGSILAAACDDGSIPIWTIENAKKGQQPTKIFFTNSRSPCCWISFSNGGEFLSFCSDKGEVSVVVLKSVYQETLQLHKCQVDSVCFMKNLSESKGDLSPKLYTFCCTEGMIGV
jgi:WD40 repeat protein